MHKIAKIIWQLSFLWLIYFASTIFVQRLSLPIPGSVLGMILLFVLLLSGVIKEEWISDAASPLLNHLAFFFIPIAVGLMEWGGLFLQKGILLITVLVVSALIALASTGWLVQAAAARFSDGENPPERGTDG